MNASLTSAAHPDLVLFTAAFPFDNSEPYLADELEVTAGCFRRIFVVPSHIGATAGPLPPNATVVDLGWGARWPRAAKVAALRSRAAAAVAATTMLNRDNLRSYTGGARFYLDVLAQNLLKAQSLARLIDARRLADAVFYDYWFENSTLALAILKYRHLIRCAVARAHRFDVFDSSWTEVDRVPFREFKLRQLDAVFPVSEDAERYLRSRLVHHPRFAPLADKLQVSHLGVRQPRTFPQDPADADPVVVSCAALLPRKQVHLIPAVLAACDRRIHWVHFGDGPERERVEAAAASLPSDVTWELRGSVDNSSVREFYATHYVSAFLSLGNSEGIPVSMMEAQSFGVPIVALAVGGVPELVTAATGLLVPAAASPSDIARALVEALTPGRFAAPQIRAAFAERYEAVANYRAFVAPVLALWSDAGASA